MAPFKRYEFSRRPRTCSLCESRESWPDDEPRSLPANSITTAAGIFPPCHLAICIHIQTQTHAYKHTYIRTNIHAYVHTYIRAYIYTIIHFGRVAVITGKLAHIGRIISYLENLPAAAISTHSVNTAVRAVGDRILKTRTSAAVPRMD